MADIKIKKGSVIIPNTQEIKVKKGSVAVPENLQTYDINTDPLLSGARSFVQGVLPITRIAGGIAAENNPQIPALQALNPYQGKEGLAKGLAYGADIAGQVSQGLNIAAPGTGLVTKAGIAGLQGLMGVGSDVLANKLKENPEANKFLNSDIGKALTDYALPIASIAASGLSLKGFKGFAGEKSNINNFLERNPQATKDMFNSLNKIENNPKAIENMGFKSAGGNLTKVGEELLGDIKQTVGKEKINFANNYAQVKDIPVPKENIANLIKLMEQEGKGLKLSREATALKNDIIKYTTELKKYKKMTVSELDNIKRAWYDDVADIKKNLSGTNADRISQILGNEMTTTIENAIPTEKLTAYKAAKGSYRSMKEAIDDIKNIEKYSPETIIKRINDGDRIEALDRLVSNPENINAALKATAKSKYPDNPAGAVKEYLDRLRKIDEVNPDMASKLFNVKELPKYGRTTGGQAFFQEVGSGLGSATSEINIANPEERKRIKIDRSKLVKGNISKTNLQALEERKKNKGKVTK